MKRVYYSGFIPVNPYDKRLPALDKAPLVRENRLYQADWLMRFYGFRAEEIADEQTPRLDLDIDPKLAWALRNPAFFPVDVNRADYEALLRVPGIGVTSAKSILRARRTAKLDFEGLPDADAAVAAADRRGDEEGAVFHQLPGTYCGAGRQRTAPRAGAPPADRSAAAEIRQKRGTADPVLTPCWSFVTTNPSMDCSLRCSTLIRCVCSPMH